MPANPPQDAVASPVNVHFLGEDRQRHLDALISAWKSARHDPSVEKHGPRVVVLHGESGIGKTRIVHEFYRWLTENQDPAH